MKDIPRQQDPTLELKRRKECVCDVKTNETVCTSRVLNKYCLRRLLHCLLAIARKIVLYVDSGNKKNNDKDFIMCYPFSAKEKGGVLKTNINNT